MSATPVNIGAADQLDAVSPPGYTKVLYDMSGGNTTIDLGYVTGPVKDLVQHMGLDVLVVLSHADATIKFGLITSAATDDDYFVTAKTLSTATAGTRYGTDVSGGWSFASTADTEAKRTITGPAKLYCTITVNSVVTGSVIVWSKREHKSTLYGTPVNRTEA